MIPFEKRQSSEINDDVIQKLYNELKNNSDDDLVIQATTHKSYTETSTTKLKKHYEELIEPGKNLFREITVNYLTIKNQDNELLLQNLDKYVDVYIRQDLITFHIYDIFKNKFLVYGLNHSPIDIGNSFYALLFSYHTFWRDWQENPNDEEKIKQNKQYPNFANLQNHYGKSEYQYFYEEQYMPVVDILLDFYAILDQVDAQTFLWAKDLSFGISNVQDLTNYRSRFVLDYKNSENELNKLIESISGIEEFKLETSQIKQGVHQAILVLKFKEYNDFIIVVSDDLKKVEIQSLACAQAIRMIEIMFPKEIQQIQKSFKDIGAKKAEQDLEDW